MVRPMVIVATASRRGRPAGMPSATGGNGVGEGEAGVGASAIVYCGTVGRSPPIVVRCMNRLCLVAS